MAGRGAQRSRPFRSMIARGLDRAGTAPGSPPRSAASRRGPPRGSDAAPRVAKGTNPGPDTAQGDGHSRAPGSGRRPQTVGAALRPSPRGPKPGGGLRRGQFSSQDVLRRKGTFSQPSPLQSRADGSRSSKPSTAAPSARQASHPAAAARGQKENGVKSAPRRAERASLSPPARSPTSQRRTANRSGSLEGGVATAPQSVQGVGPITPHHSGGAGGDRSRTASAPRRRVSRAAILPATRGGLAHPSTAPRRRRHSVQNGRPPSPASRRSRSGPQPPPPPASPSSDAATAEGEEERPPSHSPPPAHGSSEGEVAAPPPPVSAAQARRVSVLRAGLSPSGAAHRPAGEERAPSPPVTAVVDEAVKRERDRALQALAEEQDARRMDAARWRAERAALREEAEQGYTSLSADLTARARHVATALRREADAARRAAEEQAAQLLRERDCALEEVDRLQQQLEAAQQRVCALEDECGRLRAAAEEAREFNALHRELASEREAREEAQSAARLLAGEVAELRQRSQAPQTSPVTTRRAPARGHTTTTTTTAASAAPRRTAALHASMRSVATKLSPSRGEPEHPASPPEPDGALAARIDASRALVHALDAASRVKGGMQAHAAPLAPPLTQGERPPAKAAPAAPAQQTPEKEFRALFQRTRAAKRRQRTLHAPGEEEEAEGGPALRGEEDAEHALAGEEELQMRPPIEIASGPG